MTIPKKYSDTLLGPTLLWLLDHEAKNLAKATRQSALYDMYFNIGPAFQRLTNDDLRRVLTQIPIDQLPTLAERVLAQEHATLAYHWRFANIARRYRLRKGLWKHKESLKEADRFWKQIRNAVDSLNGRLNSKQWYTDVAPYLRFPTPSFDPTKSGSVVHRKVSGDKAALFESLNARAYVVEPLQLQLRLMKRILEEAEGRFAKEYKELTSQTLPVSKSKRVNPLHWLIATLAEVYEGRDPGQWEDGLLNDVGWKKALDHVRHVGVRSTGGRYEGKFLDFLREFCRIFDPPTSLLDLGRTAYDVLTEREKKLRSSQN